MKRGLKGLQAEEVSPALRHHYSLGKGDGSSLVLQFGVASYFKRTLKFLNL